MNTIVRYFFISLKKNFAYRFNVPLVVLDEIMDCISLFIFWGSLLEINLNLVYWNEQSIEIFIGWNFRASFLRVYKHFTTIYFAN